LRRRARTAESALNTSTDAAFFVMTEAVAIGSLSIAQLRNTA